jgi:hypothetical protein
MEDCFLYHLNHPRSSHAYPDSCGKDIPLAVVTALALGQWCGVVAPGPTVCIFRYLSVTEDADEWRFFHDHHTPYPYMNLTNWPNYKFVVTEADETLTTKKIKTNYKKITFMKKSFNYKKSY